MAPRGWVCRWFSDRNAAVRHVFGPTVGRKERISESRREVVYREITTGRITKLIPKRRGTMVCTEPKRKR